MSRNHRGKRSKLSETQRNQQKGLRWFIKIFAQYEKDELELINTITEEENKLFLNTTFGVSDSIVYPCFAFDGCVLRDPKGQGAFQNRAVVLNDVKVTFYESEVSMEEEVFQK